MRRSDWLFLMVLVVTVAAVAGALYFSESESERGRRLEATGTETGAPLIGGAFNLVDQNGVAVTENDLLGRWTLIYFGYTFCPDVCPVTLTNMGAAIDALGSAGERIVPMFMTVDPKRDTVEGLKEYAQHFHPRTRFVTGSEAEIDRAMKAFRVYRSIRAEEGNENYLVDHTSILYVMGPDGKFVTSFSHATSVSEMTERLRRLL
jgi:cytochrome oxidase Cu insertion factor (SCO1/SenC/PrrC family)